MSSSAQIAFEGHSASDFPQLRAVALLKFADIKTRVQGGWESTSEHALDNLTKRLAEALAKAWDEAAERHRGEHNEKISEVEKLTQRITDLEEERRGLLAGAEHVAGRNEQLKDERITLNREIGTLLGRLNEAERHVAELIDERDELQYAVDCLKRDKAEVIKHRDELQRALDLVKYDRDQLHEQKERGTFRGGELIAERDSLVRERNNLKDKIDALDALAREMKYIANHLGS